jgi:hypothetical protein
MKPVATIAAVGIVGLIVTKLLWLMFLPLVGMFIGFLVMVLKVALIAALIWAGFKVFQKLTEKPSEA